MAAMVLFAAFATIILVGSVLVAIHDVAEDLLARRSTPPHERSGTSPAATRDRVVVHRRPRLSS